MDGPKLALPFRNSVFGRAGAIAVVVFVDLIAATLLPNLKLCDATATTPTGSLKKRTNDGLLRDVRRRSSIVEQAKRAPAVRYLP
jgi:hypothetical protein